MATLDAFQLDHIAMAIPDDAEVGGLLVETLGGVAVKAGSSPAYRFWQWGYAGGGKLEVLRPDGPPGGFVHRFLESRGRGVHHVTFGVPLLDRACSRAESHGFAVVSRSDGDPSWMEAFLHPKQAEGIVVQLVEEHPELRERGPSLPPPTRRRVRRLQSTVVGLRLGSTDLARARLLWGTVCGGSAEEVRGEIRFCWPDSPLRIAVDLEAGRPAGPRTIEVAADWDLALPVGREPSTGVCFTQVRD